MNNNLSTTSTEANDAVLVVRTIDDVLNLKQGQRVVIKGEERVFVFGELVREGLYKGFFRKEEEGMRPYFILKINEGVYDEEDFRKLIEQAGGVYDENALI